MVENEDMIGTLIDTNERIIAALETYDKVNLQRDFGSLCSVPNATTAH